MGKNLKTNAVRLLDKLKLPYKIHDIELKDAVSGEDAALLLGVSPSRVFKTLVTKGSSGEHYVFVIQADRVLDLKKAAKSVGEKSIEMIKSKELLPLTGYVHGGCSPIGMKKYFKTTFDVSAKDISTIYISAGKIGLQLEISIGTIAKVIDLSCDELTATD